MQGNCSTSKGVPPEAGDLAVAMRAGQCVIVVAADLFVVRSPQLWMDNLYIRLAIPTLAVGDEQRKNKFASLVGFPPLKEPAEHYLTRMTFEGDGDGPSCGVWADSEAYIEGAPHPPVHTRLPLT